MLNRMKDCADAQPRDQQAGFRKDRSSTDQIATLRIIVEQLVEWSSTPYINFIDYKKAFDSMDRTTPWKLLRHYNVPQKIVNIIRNYYDGLNSKIVNGGQLADSLKVKTGVRRGCLLSTFLFPLAIDWIMKTSTSGGKRGIRWTSRMQLDDLDFTDDLTLLSQTQQQMQEKTNSVVAASAAVSLNIHKEKSKILRYNTTCINPITLDGEDLEKLLMGFTLSSIVRQGCLPSPFLFLLVVDWIMKTSTTEGKHGIQSYTHEQMQTKTASVATVSPLVDLNIHKGKSKI
ncbi:unnamed protein product, partial [Schistosoma mattheei]